MKPSLLKRALPRSGLGLTSLGFGSMAIGGQYLGVTETEAVDTVTAALDAGVSFFDTAPQYGCGMAEERLGVALSARDAIDAVVCTKVGKLIAPLGSGGQRQTNLHFPGGHDCELVFDYSYDATKRSIEASLGRLGRATVEIALVHDVTRHFHGESGVHEAAERALGGALVALRQLREEGVVKAIGTGLKDVDIAARFVEEADIDVVLVPGRMTLLDQSALTTGLLDLCEKHAVGVVAAAPFDSGILATGPIAGARYGYQAASQEMIERTRAIAEVCNAHGVELASAALQFALRHPAVVSVLAGMRDTREVAENVARMIAPVPPELWAELAKRCSVKLPG